MTLTYCDVCGRAYKDLACHLREHPDCEDDDDIPGLASGSEDSDSEDETAPAVSAKAALAHELANNNLQDLVCNDLTELRLDHGQGNADIARLKRMVSSWVEEHNRTAHDALQPLLRKGVTPEQVQTALGTISIFNGMETAATELARAKEGCAYVEPRVVQLSDEKDDKVVSFSVKDLIARDLQESKSVRQQLLKTSDRLKTGECYRKMPEGEITEAIEAAEARFHPHLWRPATDDEVDDVRIPFEFNCDEVEVSACLLPLS
jgi:hypothetical protein